MKNIIYSIVSAFFRPLKVALIIHINFVLVTVNKENYARKRREKIKREKDIIQPYLIFFFFFASCMIFLYVSVIFISESSWICTLMIQTGLVILVSDTWQSKKAKHFFIIILYYQLIFLYVWYCVFVKKGACNPFSFFNRGSYSLIFKYMDLQVKFSSQTFF